MTYQRILGAVALTGFATQSFALLRWNGDVLMNNNPPAANANLPAPIQGAVVRILLGYFMPGSGVESQVYGTGVVIGARRDSPTSATGRLCVLTGFHNTEAKPGHLAALARVIVGFGNGEMFPAPRLSARYRDLIRPAVNGQGRAPDLTIVPIAVTNWGQQVPNNLPNKIEIDDAAVDSSLTLAGFGRTGKVDVANRRYDLTNDAYGTFRSGTNTVDAQVDNTTAASPRTGTQFEYASLRSDMDMTPANAAPTFGEAHFMNMDSGGPTFQKFDQDWKLVGIHSDSEINAQDQVKEGFNQWDVRANTYKEWIDKSCTQALVPEPTSMAAMVAGFLWLVRRRTANRR